MMQSHLRKRIFVCVQGSFHKSPIFRAQTACTHQRQFSFSLRRGESNDQEAKSRLALSGSLIGCRFLSTNTNHQTRRGAFEDTLSHDNVANETSPSESRSVSCQLNFSTWYVKSKGGTPLRTKE